MPATKKTAEITIDSIDVVRLATMLETTSRDLVAALKLLKKARDKKNAKTIDRIEDKVSSAQHDASIAVGVLWDKLQYAEKIEKKAAA
jgi:hypothetical protein